MRSFMFVGLFFGVLGFIFAGWCTTIDPTLRELLMEPGATSQMALEEGLFYLLVGAVSVLVSLIIGVTQQRMGIR